MMVPPNKVELTSRVTRVLYSIFPFKFRKFERKYRDCIKKKGDKIETQTCYDVSM